MTKTITIEKAQGIWVVRGGGAIVAESNRALKLSEDGHAPVIYFPREDVGMALLDRSETRTTCPHKGEATHYSLQTKSTLVEDVAWSYEDPIGEVSAIKDHLAFYPERLAIERI